LNINVKYATGLLTDFSNKNKNKNGWIFCQNISVKLKLVTTLLPKNKFKLNFFGQTIDV